jgi:dsDNA-binding SOS-regulon protein
VLPDSDEDNQANPSPQSTSSPSPPSSEEFTSDPTRFDWPSAISGIVPTTFDSVLPSSAIEFNFPHTTAEPTLSFTKPPPKEDPTIIIRKTHTNPVFVPPRLSQTNNIMNPTQVGVNSLPIQGKRDAPRTFKGSYDQVEDFLKTMDKLFAHYQVTLDDEKVEAILLYCSSKVQDFVRSLPSFTIPNWNELKDDMMEDYDAERATLKFSPKHIGGFIKMWNAMEITDLVQWKKYY